MRRLGWALLSILPLLGARGASGGEAPPTRFAQTQVEAQVFASEPKLLIDDQTVYVVAPDGDSTIVWRSLDRGVTFERLPSPPGGGGDSDIAIDGCGAVYVADLDPGSATGVRSIPISTSLDGGRTYAHTVNLAPDRDDLDRQWIASAATGQVVAIAWADFELLAWVSNDFGKSFSGPVVATRDIDSSGPLVAGPGGYYTILDALGALRWARSPDGVEWTTGLIAGGGADPVIFPNLTVDEAGNMYAVWTQSTYLNSCTPTCFATFAGPVYFSRSTDDGQTWSKPMPLSPATRSAMFPWVVVGSPGKVAVTYVVARQTTGTPDLGPNLSSALTQWDLVMRQSTNALSSAPTWRQTVIARNFHTGSLCTLGASCPGQGILNAPIPLDRRDLDFAGATLDAEGRVFVGYSRDRPLSADLADILLANTDLMVARQTGGKTLR